MHNATAPAAERPQTRRNGTPGPFVATERAGAQAAAPSSSTAPRVLSWVYSAQPAEGREAGRLGSTGNSFSGLAAEPVDLRARRYRRRELHRKIARRDELVEVPGKADIDPATGEVIRQAEARRVSVDDKYLGCGKRVRTKGQGVVVTLGDSSAGVKNVQACGSGWSCAVCSGKVQQHRAAELGKVLAWARAEGHTLAMVTLTVKHKRGDSLASVWDAVSSGWHAVTGGVGAGYWGSEKVEKFEERRDRWESACMSAWAGFGRMPKGGYAGIRPERRIGDQERYGILGWARAVEVTNGLNGWHVHVHAVLVLKGERQAAEAAAHEAGAAMFRRWVVGLGKVGFTATKRDGLHVSVTEGAEKRLAEYLTKDGKASDDSRGRRIASNGKKARKLAMEATLTDTKGGRRGGKTPFEILDAVEGEGSGLWLRLWREWVDTSAGRLGLTWSAGLRELAELPPDCLTDEEVAGADPEGVEVLHLTDEAWGRVWVDQLDLFRAGEVGGAAGLVSWLDERKIPYELIDPGVKRT